jgi:hypothetical protein
MKRAISLLLILCFALCLASCGKSGQFPVRPTPAGGVSEPSAAPAPAPEAPAEESPAPEEPVPETETPIPAQTPAETETPEPETGICGTWTLEEVYNTDGDTLFLVLEPDGNGYAIEDYLPWSGDRVRDYSPLTWTDSAFVIEEFGGVISYTLEGDRLVVPYEGYGFIDEGVYTFVRTEEDPFYEAEQAPAASYMLLQVLYEGEDATEDYGFDDGGYVLVLSDGTAYGTLCHNKNVQASYDRHFIYYDYTDSDGIAHTISYFYTWDGEFLTVRDGTNMLFIYAIL